MRSPLLQLEEISGHAGIDALASEWSALWERCPGATPFQSPEWLTPWRRHFGNDRALVLALRKGETLTGLIPLFSFRNGQGLRQISLWGSGITDYLDLLIEPDAARAGTGMLLDYLLSQRPQWDLCEFEELRPESPLLSAPAVTDLSAEVSAMEVCPVLPLPGTVEAFRQGLTAHLRRRLRYCLNSLGKRGEVSFETATAGTLPEFLEALFSLHRKVWRQRGERGVLDNPRIKVFHREVTEGFLARGWLRLSALRLGTAIVAVLYSFAARGRLYCYLSGFDPAIAAFSPGKLIIWRAIEQAIGEGLQELDFLRGAEGYKYLWGSQDRPNYRLIIKNSK